MWQIVPACNAQRLQDSIETEAANAVKAVRLKTEVEERLKALEERLNHDA